MTSAVPSCRFASDAQSARGVSCCGLGTKKTPNTAVKPCKEKRRYVKRESEGGEITVGGEQRCVIAFPAAATLASWWRYARTCSDAGRRNGECSGAAAIAAGPISPPQKKPLSEASGNRREKIDDSSCARP
tara:strand:+ start:127 stop:519 length:393 start_codon:yes stop_codon:yes gene_type:complete